MSYEPRFYLNNKYIRASVYCDDDRATPSTGLRAESLDNLPRNIQRVLDRIKLRVEEHVGYCEKQDKRILKDEVTDIILLACGKISARKEYKTVKEIANDFYLRIKTGEILNKFDKKYSDSSIELMDYAIKAAAKTSLLSIRVDELTGVHFEQFRSKLVGMENGNGTPFTANAINTYNKLMAGMVLRTYKMGWHDNNIGKSKGKLWGTGEDVEYPIFYSSSELQALSNHKFTSKSLEIVRDVFVFGCYTCLRHSDYYLTDYTMSVTDDILSLKGKKTSKTVDIPLHPIALKILEKYGNNLPKLEYASLNDRVKTMAHKAGMDTMCLFSRIEGGEVVQEHVPKWKLTTTHTMRRSFATNAFIAMMPERLIMKIGGWKTYKSFERYLRLSGIDMAKLMKEQPFYKWEQ